MTILVALHDPKDKCTWLGGDTMVRVGGTHHYNDLKWFIYDQWAVGCSGETRCMNVIEARCDDIFSGIDGPFEFSENLSTVLRDEGFGNTAKENESGPINFGYELILASPRAIWSFDGVLGFDPQQNGKITACGAGDTLALGAAYAAAALGCPAETIVRLAIEAAMAHSIYCGGEPWFYQLKAI